MAWQFWILHCLLGVLAFIALYLGVAAFTTLPGVATPKSNARTRIPENLLCAQLFAGMPLMCYALLIAGPNLLWPISALYCKWG